MVRYRRLQNRYKCAAWVVRLLCLFIFVFVMPGIEPRASDTLVPSAMKLRPQPCLPVSVMIFLFSWHTARLLFLFHSG